MSRKKNACFVRMVPDGISFVCGARATVCEFGVYREDMPSHIDQDCAFQDGLLKMQCTNHDAQNDAMSRAAHSIQEEQCRRANAWDKYEEIRSMSHDDRKDIHDFAVEKANDELVDHERKAFETVIRDSESELKKSRELRNRLDEEVERAR